MAKKIAPDKVQLGIDIDGDGKPDFAIDLKTVGMFLVLISTVIGMWFTLKADIQLAKELPEAEIQRIEFQMKDEAIRDAIMNTQNDVEEIKKQLDKIDERLYDLQSRN